MISIREEYDKGLEQDHSGLPSYEGSGDVEDIMWFKQTIGLACGLPGLLDTTAPQDLHASKPHECALALEAFEGLEKVHALAGESGATEAPSDLEDDVDYHYACFIIRSHKSGRLYDLDDMKLGPINTGVALAEGEDIVFGPALQLVRSFISREQQRY
ncbi:ubiquitinyl hydrolase 1 [Marasmius crinis-equi]|uniref:ubiquitinyl hydrolase 1 n=1 Tax=Marasmius crinis-equi TaxID=585013 RepID=A0ABR3EV65_9AGAR